MDLSEVIQEFKARVVLLYGARFKKLIFDGPQFDEEGEGPLIPLLVVIEGDLLLDREVERLGEIVTDLQYSHGIMLSVLPVSSCNDNRVYAPLYLESERPWIIA